MTSPRFGRRGETRPLVLVSLALALVVVFAVSTHPVRAQSEQAPADVVTPVEEFARQVDQLKKSYPDLAKRIEDGAKTIDEVTDVERARKEIEELRTIVGNMLGAVSDNGVVSQLGAKALSHARVKLKTLEQEQRFLQEERQFLVDLWRKLIVE